MTPQEKFNILKPVIDSKNALHGDHYTIEVCEACDGCEIKSRDGRFGGTLISDIAMLAAVYSWSYGIYRAIVHPDNGELYILI